MTHTTTLLLALLAAGLAVALSREHRIRRAFQTLAARLLDKLRSYHGSTGTPANTAGPNHPPHSPRRRS